MKVFHNERVLIDTIPVTRSDGSIYEHHRITVRSGKGALLLPYTDEGCLGVVRQWRVPLAQETIEFPGGGVREFTQKEALQELLEETGLLPKKVTPLGFLHPAGGVLTSTAQAWAVLVEEATAAALTPEVESGATFQWLSQETFEQLIVDGGITCALTLATYLLALRKLPLLAR